MGGEAGEEAARPLAAKEPARRAAGRGDRLHAEARHEEWMPRGRPQGRQEVGEQLVGRVHERRERLAIGVGVGAEGLGGGLDRALEHGRRTVVEGVRGRRRREQPLEAVLAQREALEERRRHAEGMDRRAEVVDEAGSRQLGRPGAAAHGRRGFDEQHRPPRARERDGGGQTVGARAHDDGVAGGGL